MSKIKKLSSKEMYNKLCTEYPDINPKPGENLNIEERIVDILKKCWYDKHTYFTVKDIADVVDTSERTIYKYARKHKFQNRKKNFNYGEVQSN